MTPAHTTPIEAELSVALERVGAPLLRTVAEAKEARGLPTGRPAKLNATTRAGAAQRIKAGAIPGRSPPSSASAAPRCTGNCASTAKVPQPNPSDEG